MFTKKLFTMFAIALFAVLSATSEINAQIKIGSQIALNNQYPDEGGWLETQALVKDNPEFLRLVPSETNFVASNRQADSNSAKAKWQILSATGKKNTDPLMYGDKIYLKSMVTGAGYLDNCGFLKDISVYKPLVAAGQQFAVFTTQSSNRDSGSGTWIVKNADNTTDGGIVKDGDKIVLENAFSKDINGTTYKGGFLDTQGRTQYYVKELKGLNVLLHSTTANRHENSGLWQISAK